MMSKQQQGSNRISFSAKIERLSSCREEKGVVRTCGDAADGADVDTAEDADAKDGALALRDSGSQKEVKDARRGGRNGLVRPLCRRTCRC